MEDRNLQKIFDNLYCPTPNNLYFENPIQPGNELDFGFNINYMIYGYHYSKEMFYLIDFWDIKENMYLISSYGRVFSLYMNKELSPASSDGYKRVSLACKDGNYKSFFVHRLVCTAFIPKSNEDIINKRDLVNHKDTIKSNNYFRNLEWSNNSENRLHAYSNNTTTRLQIIQKSYNNEYSTDSTTKGKTRITDEQVHIICQNLIQGKSYQECCEKAGLENTARNRNVISNIAAGKRREKITKQYGIIEETKLTRDLDKGKKKFVIPVCKLLEKGYSTSEITMMLPIDTDYHRARVFVNGIKSKKTYKKISDLYNF